MSQQLRIPLFIILALLIGSFAQSSEILNEFSNEIPLGPEGPDQATREASVILAEKSAAGVTLHLRAPVLEVSDKEVDGQSYQLINLPGAELDGPVGQPALPLVTRLVAVPDGKTLSVNNLTTRDTQVDGDFRPWPAQGLKNSTDKSISLDTPYYLGVNKAAISQPLVTVGEPSLLRGIRVVPVYFRPVVWNPGDTGLNVAAEIDATFDLVDASDNHNSAGYDRKIPQSFVSILESQVLGFDKRASNVMEGPGTYLMIHPDNATVLANLQPLISWRQRQGYNVVVASTAVTGTSTTSIKNYLQNQYNNLDIPLEFVALVGDATGAVTLPTYIENLSGYNGEGDHEYTLLEGGDLLSDVHLGRLSVTSTSQLADVVSKIVSYESDPWMQNDINWFTRAGLAGDPSSSGYSTIWVNQWVKQQLLELNYTQVDTIWSGSFATQIFNTVSAGESIFGYRGYWGMSGVDNNYIEAMNNGEKLPFALILTCGTGSFRSDTTARSEAFFRNPSGGGIASIGTATLGTHTRYNNCMYQGVAQGALNSGDSRVGPALTSGKLHLYQNYIQREVNNVEIWSTWNNLMGDPATPLWSNIPSILTVDYPGSLSVGANNLPVTVTSGGVPQEGALVTVFGEDFGGSNHFSVSAVTDSDGKVNLPLSGLTERSYLVTVTGRNLKPYLGSLNAGSVAASVNFSSVVVDDDNIGSSLGNGNLIANPGETLELMIDLVNNGTGGVSNVTADLGSGNPLVSVDQGTADFGSFTSGETRSGQQAFVVTLDPAVRGGSVISFELVAGNGSESWTSLVDLPISGPAGEVVHASLGSGSINPGGSSTLVVNLENIGDLATTGATASLSSNSNWISVTDAYGTFGAISAGGSATNSWGRIFHHRRGRLLPRPCGHPDPGPGLRRRRNRQLADPGGLWQRLHHRSQRAGHARLLRLRQHRYRLPVRTDL